MRTRAAVSARGVHMSSAAWGKSSKRGIAHPRARHRRASHLSPHPALGAHSAGQHARNRGQQNRRHAPRRRRATRRTRTGSRRSPRTRRVPQSRVARPSAPREYAQISGAGGRDLRAVSRSYFERAGFGEGSEKGCISARRNRRGHKDTRLRTCRSRYSRGRSH